MRHRLAAIAGVAVIVASLAYVFYFHTRPEQNGFGPEHDFVTVITGSRCIVDRCDPYDSPTLVREFQKMGGYAPRQHWKAEWPVYPPSTLLLLFPLSLASWPIFSVLWMLLCYGLVAAAFVALFLKCEAYRDLLSALPFVILLADGSIAWAVQLGQPILIAGGALALAVLAIESSMPISGALLLALSLLIKPQCAYLLVVYLLLRRSTRLPALAACVLTACVGMAGTLVFYVRLSSMAYLRHLANNLKVAMQPGGDADFSLHNKDSGGYLNLQAFFARFDLNYALCNRLTYAVGLLLLGVLIYVCWRTKTLHTRPYTILAVLVMLELLVSYHRLYDHILILSAIPGVYEVKARGIRPYLLLVGGLFVYHFSQFHGIRLHGLGPFSSGPPVELWMAGVCLYSLWNNKPDEGSPFPPVQVGSCTSSA